MIESGNRREERVGGGEKDGGIRVEPAEGGGSIVAEGGKKGEGRLSITLCLPLGDRDAQTGVRGTEREKGRGCAPERHAVDRRGEGGVERGVQCQLFPMGGSALTVDTGDTGDVSQATAAERGGAGIKVSGVGAKKTRVPLGIAARGSLPWD